MSTQWLALKLCVPAAVSEAVCNFLFECGTSGLQTDDDNGQTSITAYFDTIPPVEAIRRFLDDIGGPDGAAEFYPLHVTEIAEQDWAENWKQHFAAQVVGRQLYVCPPWDSACPPHRIRIVIEPGMAFGTGLHATTRGCLELLEAAVERTRTDRGLDLGTGSGILAIAMAKLGVPDVRAVDIDPVARAVAADNAARNGVADRIVVSDSLEAAGGPFDLVVANLFANALIESATRLVARTESRGSIICAGFLTDDEAAIRDAYQRTGWSVAARREEGNWVTLQFTDTTRR
jgi:ribosomal protein L11 methyltransferase